MSNYSGLGRMFAAAAVVWLFPFAIIAQQQEQRMEDLLKKAKSAPTPMTADGHPDLNGLWNVAMLRGKYGSKANPG